MADIPMCGVSKPGALGDRADRSVFDWPVLICVFGDFRVLSTGCPVEIRNGAKSEHLLALLALGPRSGLPRHVLLSDLWPDQEPSLAGESLNTLTYRLHRVFKRALSGASPVVHANGLYRLNREAGVGVDADVMESLACRGAELACHGKLREATELYEQAIGLYRGELRTALDMPGVLERERLRELVLNLLARVAVYYFDIEDYSMCLEKAMLLLRHDPCREQMHRIVMQSFMRTGRRSSALHQYRVCEAILRNEFDASPEAATVALFNLIRVDPGSV